VIELRPIPLVKQRRHRSLSQYLNPLHLNGIERKYQNVLESMKKPMNFNVKASVALKVVFKAPK
jgi:hypothetical protein